MLTLFYRGENWPEGEANTEANMERLQAVTAPLSRPATTKPLPHFGPQNYIMGQGPYLGGLSAEPNDRGLAEHV